MVRVYLSPRYEVSPARTRNLLALFVSAPDSFDEIANLPKGYGICSVDAPQTVHDAIMLDNRITPLTPLYNDPQDLADRLHEPYATTLPADSLSLAKTILEEHGINMAWVSASNTVKDIVRYAITTITIIQILDGKSAIINFLISNLSATVGSVPLSTRNAAKTWMQSKGLAVGWINNGTTVREVLHFIVQNLGFGQFRFAREIF